MNFSFATMTSAIRLAAALVSISLLAPPVDGLGGIGFPEDDGVDAAINEKVTRLPGALGRAALVSDLRFLDTGQARVLEAVFEQPLRGGQGNGNPLSPQILDTFNACAGDDCVGPAGPVDLHKSAGLATLLRECRK
jgi:hypothetical protein